MKGSIRTYCDVTFADFVSKYEGRFHLLTSTFACPPQELCWMQGWTHPPQLSFWLDWPSLLRCLELPCAATLKQSQTHRNRSKSAACPHGCFLSQPHLRHLEDEKCGISGTKRIKNVAWPLDWLFDSATCQFCAVWPQTPSTCKISTITSDCEKNMHASSPNREIRNSCRTTFHLEDSQGIEGIAISSCIASFSLPKQIYIFHIIFRHKPKSI